MGSHVVVPAENPPTDRAIVAFLMAMHLADVLRKIPLLSEGILAASKATYIRLVAKVRVEVVVELCEVVEHLITLIIIRPSLKVLALIQVDLIKIRSSKLISNKFLR